MVRQGVGAIISTDQGYLLVKKISSQTMDETIKGHWDFPKGGLKASDASLEDGLMRELMEEVGSRNFHIIKRYDDKLNFDFPAGHKYARQETWMFLLEFRGRISDLRPDGYEISDIDFFDKRAVLDKITLKETRAFLHKNVW